METAFRALIPIRSFDGMTRLSDWLDPQDRAQIARDLARRTTRAALEADTRVSVITADAEVQRWAISSDSIMPQPQPTSATRSEEPPSAAGARKTSINERTMQRLAANHQ